MTKKEIEEQINSNKFSTTISCYGADKLRNLIKEIYFDGMREGYELARFRLDLLHRMPFSSGDDYLDKNMDKIRETINLCELYEDCDE